MFRSSKEFHQACKSFYETKEQGQQKDLKDSFLGSFRASKQVQTFVIYSDIQVEGQSYLDEIHQEESEKQVIKYEMMLENRRQWEGLALQMEQQFLLINLEWQRVVNQPFKEQFDAINSYNLLIQNHPFLNQRTNDLFQYRLFLIVYLILGLRTIITSRRHERAFIASRGAYAQVWRNKYMSNRAQRYFDQTKKLYQGLMKEQSASCNFIFSLINKNIIDEPYVESLCILFNAFYKTCQPVPHLYMERCISTRATHKRAFIRLLKENRGVINTNKIDKKFKHCQYDRNNQMEKYRILEIREQNSSERAQKLYLLLKNFSAYPFKKHSSSTDNFYLDINPAFKKEFIHEQHSPKIKRKKHKIFDQIAGAFIQEFGPLKCFYSNAFNIICILEFDEQSANLHQQWKRQCLTSFIVSIQAQKVVLNATLKVSDNEKYSTLKIFSLKIKNMKFQGKNLKSDQKEQAYIEKIFKNILHIVRNQKDKPSIARQGTFLDILKNTRIGTSQMDIYHLRDIDKMFMIQKCCNIFLQFMEQLRIKLPVPLLQVQLQLVRFSNAFIKMRKGTTKRFKMNEKDIYNNIRHCVGYGIKNQQISQIKESIDISNYQKVYSNMKKIFESDLMKVSQFYDFGLFWSYIKVFQYIMNKYTATAIRIPGYETTKNAIRINATVRSLFSRMLKQCVLFYCLQNQYKLQYLDLQIYFIALQYGQSIKQKLVTLNDISQQEREQLIRPVTIIARMIQDKVNNISKCLKQTKLIDVMAIAQEFDKQVKEMYKFNIPYTRETFEECFNQVLAAKYGNYSCKQCRLCKHFNLFFFEGQDCFTRFPQCLKLIVKKFNVNYTKGYEEITHGLFKY